MVRRIGCVLLLVLLAAGAFLVASCGTIRAGYLVRDALKPAGELAPLVTETEMRVPASGGEIRMRIYRPRDADEPLPGVILIHGAVIDGADNVRLIGLARAMAIRGGTVATPDLESLRRFRLDPGDPDRVVAAAVALADRDDLVADGRIALVGISVGGSYGLLAALDARVRDRLSAILTFGAYSDLEWLLRRWMTDPNSDTPELLDPQTTGRRLVLQGNLGVLLPAGEREAVSGVLDRLLRGRHDLMVPEGLSPAAARIVGVAISEGPVDAATVDALLAPLEEDIGMLSPTKRKSSPRVPVYLLHGERDPIVPVADLETLAEFLARRGTEVDAYATDIFSHVNRMGEGSPSLFSAWPFLSFLADFLSDAGY